MQLPSDKTMFIHAILVGLLARHTFAQTKQDTFVKGKPDKIPSAFSTVAHVDMDLFARPELKVVFGRNWINQDELMDIKTKNGASVMMMKRTQDGSQALFACLIPNTTIIDTPGLGSSKLSTLPAESSSKTGASSSSTTDNVLFRNEATQAGLKLIKSIKCIYFIPGGYWTYELCANGNVRQFNHAAEKAKAAKTSEGEPTEYILGKSTKIKLQDVVLKKESGGSVWVLKEVWSGGTHCDIIGSAREVTIEYQCSQNSGDVISSLREVSSCKYYVVVHTSRLCRDPTFVHQVAHQTPLIECHPMSPLQNTLTDKSDASSTVHTTSDSKGLQEPDEKIDSLPQIKKPAPKLPSMTGIQILKYEHDLKRSPFAGPLVVDLDKEDTSKVELNKPVTVKDANGVISKIHDETDVTAKLRVIVEDTKHTADKNQPNIFSKFETTSSDNINDVDKEILSDLLQQAASELQLDQDTIEQAIESLQKLIQSGIEDLLDTENMDDFWPLLGEDIQHEKHSDSQDTVDESGDSIKSEEKKSGIRYKLKAGIKSKPADNPSFKKNKPKESDEQDLNPESKHE
ncbi:hypothetical protein BDV3_005353 [Batrachochytrium dendrobatidis]